MSNVGLKRPDYDYWLLVKVWSSYEAANLIVGIEPHSLPFYPARRSIEEVRIEKGVENLLRILRGAARNGDFGKVRYGGQGEEIFPNVSWKDWVAWTEQHNIEVSPDLLATIANHKNQVTMNEPLHPRLEATYQRIIGAMLDLLVGETNEKANSIFRNQEAVVQAIVDRYGNRDGISERNLDEKFATANRRLTQD